MQELIITIGRYDNPQKQTQDDYEYNLLNSNLAVFGSSMSGKTTLLKTLMLRMHQQLKLTTQEEIYILDFGSGLKAYYDLPYVVGYFSASHEENVRRVFKIMEEKLLRNSKKLEGGNFAEVPENKQPNHVTFLLDGFSSFISEDRFSVYHETLKKLAREGLSKGITVVITAAETVGFGRLLPSFKTIVALDIPKDRYGDLFNGKVEKPMILPGRGIINQEMNTYEFQAFMPWKDQDSSKTGQEEKDARNPKKKNSKSAEEQMILRTSRWLELYGTTFDLKMLDADDVSDDLKKMQEDPKNRNQLLKNQKIHEEYSGRKLKNLPEKLTAKNWSSFCKTPFDQEEGVFVAGLDYYTLEPVPSVEPVALNLMEAQTIAIYGRKEFGKSNLLKLLLESANRLQNTHFYFWDDGREALTKPDGLRKTIENLQYKEYLNSREEFWSTLGKIGFLKLAEQNPDEEGMYDDVESSDLDYEDALDQKRRDFRHEQNAWYDQQLDEFTRLREQMDQEGTYTAEWERETRAAIEAEFEDRKKKFEEMLEQMEMEMTQGTTDYSAEETPEETCDYLSVFVVQSRLFYQNPPGGERYHMIPHIASAMGSGKNKILFIFSDVQRIESPEVQTYFNNSIRYAFLLDDIVRFINNKGQRSVFGNQEVSELKERFGPCEVGDGYFFDIDRDDLIKLKFLHASPLDQKESEE